MPQKRMSSRSDSAHIWSLQGELQLLLQARPIENVMK